MSIASEWNIQQKELKELIEKKETFDKAKDLYLSMHRNLHFSDSDNTLMDQLWKILDTKDFSIMPTAKDVTIAWNIWHITRIEDLTVNILVNNSEQIYNKEWQKKMNVSVNDTGNAMTDDEIMDLSKSINIEALKEYRKAVGIQTQSIFSKLKFEDMKRKAESKGIEKILNEGGVTDHPDSIWLLDFWGKKNVAGIILMPGTRHQIGHINDCYNLKSSIDRKKDYYKS
ncbi:DinB family protein [Fusobacterium varium]|uniref:DinB family protein n=1 Tax=Fusobacterium varium TaxID=856 RepID=UPI0035662E76